MRNVQSVLVGLVGRGIVNKNSVGADAFQVGKVVNTNGFMCCESVNMTASYKRGNRSTYS